MKIDDKIPHRSRMLLFSTLELLRKEIQPKFADWKDADDWLFSQLDFTKDELKQIYKGRDTLYYDGSAVDIEAAMQKRLDGMFIFDDELMINDDFQSIYGYLWAIDALVDKLTLSRDMDNINFYADYNVLTGDIKLSASFFVSDKNSRSGERQEFVGIELNEQEKAKLIDVMQSYCKTQYSQTCLDFVNDLRKDEGLPLIINTLSELPKSFVYRDFKTNDKEVFVLGAVSECGEAFYLGCDGSFVRAGEVPWASATINDEGFPVFNDFAENCLYFEFDLDGNLESNIVEVLNQPSTIILNKNFEKFVEKHCKVDFSLDKQIQDADALRVDSFGENNTKHHEVEL